MTRSPTRPCPRAVTACSSWRPRTTPAPRRCRPPGPHFVDTYTDALAANGQQADVYDIDAAGRVAPDALGVLSHYDAVVWETGNDLVTRTAGRGGGNADRLALDELLEFRSYMNEGGKVLLAGDSAGQQYTATVGDSCTTPRARSPATRLPRVRTRGAACPCSARSSVATPPTTCCSTTWAATSPWPTTVTTEAPRSTRWASTTRSRASRGVSTIPSSLATRSGGRRSSRPAASCRSTSSSSSRAGPRRGTTSRAARSTRTPATQYVYSQIADVSYKRLTREVAVPAGGGSMTFWTSYDTEARVGPPVRGGAYSRR